MTHFLLAMTNTFSNTEMWKRKGEQGSDQIRPTRKVLFSYGLTGARVRCCHDEVISLTHRTSGWPESHSSVCKETAFCSPNPHHHHLNASTFKAASYIQKGLRTFDDAWQFFASIHAEWLCVGDCEGWMEPCVWRRWGGAELGAGGMSDCAEPLLSGKWGGRVGVMRWRCHGLRRIKSGATDGEKEADQQHLTEKDQC